MATGASIKARSSWINSSCPAPSCRLAKARWWAHRRCCGIARTRMAMTRRMRRSWWRRMLARKPSLAAPNWRTRNTARTRRFGRWTTGSTLRNTRRVFAGVARAFSNAASRLCADNMGSVRMILAVFFTTTTPATCWATCGPPSTVCAIRTMRGQEAASARR